MIGYYSKTNAPSVCFVCSDSTPENMRRLWTYLKRNGRPGAFYTDKASLFRTAPKGKRDERNLPRDERSSLPPTQIGRAGRVGDRKTLEEAQRNRKDPNGASSAHPLHTGPKTPEKSGGPRTLSN